MRPKRRPPRPKHPKFTHFHRSGLRFGRFPAQHRSIGGVGRPRRDRRAWLRCPWAVAGPGRIARQRAKPDLSTPGPTGVEGAEGSGGPGRGARGRWRGLAGSRDNAPSQISVHQAPLVWRAPEGPEGLAAAPVGGGGAWPGFEIDHSEPQARVWRSRGRAAAHGRIKQPGLTKHTRRPKHPWRPTTTTTRPTRRAAHAGTGRGSG